MEFRLPDYGPTVSTVSPFREKIVRLDRYLISAYITLWSVPEVIWLSTSIKTSLRGHEGTARRGKGWWLAWQAAGKIGDGGRKTWRDSWRIWKGRCEWWRWEGIRRFEIKAFGEAVETSLGQKPASPKCGGLFCIYPDTDMLLLELKHHALA